MPTNFGQCYVKHFYISKNLSGMGILVENFKTISHESSLLEHLVSVVKRSYRIGIEALTVNNIYQKQSAICCSFFGRPVFAGLHVQNIGTGKWSCDFSSVWDTSDIFANLVFQMPSQIIFSSETDIFYILLTVSSQSWKILNFHNGCCRFETG